MKAKTHLFTGHFIENGRTKCGLYAEQHKITFNLDKVTCNNCVRIEVERQEKFNESLYSQGH
jgi:hypothetical protein